VSGWTDFAVVVGAATAALLGLLFVAVSIRVETIAKSPELRNRSAQTLSLLLTGLLAAVLLAVPDQRKWALGIEYLVLAIVVAGVALTLDRRAGSRSVSTVGRSLDAINPTIVTCSLLVIAAVILILDHEDGLYVLVPALIAVLVGGVVNAWLILVRLDD
jgi:xanthine/uracil permease